MDINKLKAGLLFVSFSLIFSTFTFAEKESDISRYSAIRHTVEQNPPIYTNSYAKNIKGVIYGLGIQDGLIISPNHNLGSTSRKNFDGNYLLGYYQPGASVVVLVNGRSQAIYSLKDTSENTFNIKGAKITLKFESKELPVLPIQNVVQDNPLSFENAKVFFVTMDVVPLDQEPTDIKEKDNGEWFDPTLRYDYEKQVRALKDKYLSGVNLDLLNEKQLEDLARKMSAERRSLGMKFKAAHNIYVIRFISATLQSMVTSMALQFLI